ncbi:MAG: hypothetical protein U1F61_10080 [Opitutaceae bacterium]
MPPADLPPPAPAIERVVWHDCRMIHDCSLLTLAELTAEPTNQWVVATVEPAPDSGSATIPGASIDGKTGKVVVPAGGDAVIQKKGVYERQAAHGIDWVAKGTYSWTEPLDKRTRGLMPEDCYSPFAQGGVIYFRPVAGKPGLALFGRVRLLPPEWAVPFPQAAAYVRTQPGVPTSDLLKRMLTSQNAVLALLAYRELVVEHRLSGPELLAPLERARGPLRAVMARLVLDHEQPVLPGKTALDGLVERAAQRDALLPLASAAFSAVQFGAATPDLTARARAFFGRVRQQAEKLPSAPGVADPLPLMARLLGFSG